MNVVVKCKNKQDNYEVSESVFRLLSCVGLISAERGATLNLDKEFEYEIKPEVALEISMLAHCGFIQKGFSKAFRNLFAEKEQAERFAMYQQIIIEYANRIAIEKKQGGDKNE